MAFTMATDLFLEPSSIASFLSNVATKGVIAIGVTYLMISGEFDLSVGSILGVTALSFMLFMTEGAPLLGVLDPIPAAILAIFVALILAASTAFSSSRREYPLLSLRWARCWHTAPSR